MTHASKPFEEITEAELSAMYAEFCKWRQEHPDSYYVIFNTSITYSGKPRNRYVVVPGLEMYSFFGDVVIKTIAGVEQLHQPVKCATQHEASVLCRRLNAKYVHDNEPELYAECPSWQEEYERQILAKSRKNNINITDYETDSKRSGKRASVKV